VSFNQRAVDKIMARSTRVNSWFLDMQLILGYWGSNRSRAYHHTAPVNSMYSLHEALLILKEEGLSAAWARHALHHEALKAGLEAMGLSLVVPVGERLPQLNAVSIPEGVDDAAIRSQLLTDFGLEIGAGLGALAGKVWRIGLMGASSNRHNVLFCLGALESTLASASGISSGTAIAAARRVYGD
jgi:alanine-glyoxylate transaminase/serine-glyoxylate transaminase/serine-pyruvate transaminase